MFELEKKQPVKGLTLSEMAELSGASAKADEATRDLELRVIIGEAGSMGEALAHRLKARDENESEPFRMVECGWDGLDLRKPEMPDAPESPEKLRDHPNQLKFWED